MIVKRRWDGCGCVDVTEARRDPGAGTGRRTPVVDAHIGVCFKTDIVE
jgi:hypothetical protein